MITVSRYLQGLSVPFSVRLPHGRSPIKPTAQMGKSYNFRSTLHNLLPLLLALTTAFVFWRLLSLLTDCAHPIVVVVSESMAPAFHRGDLLFLSNRKPLLEVGDVPVVWFDGNPLPMVHRAVRVFNEFAPDGEIIQRILTKGDNNQITDEPLYPPGQMFVDRQEVKGLVTGYVPFLGWSTILLSADTMFKKAAIGAVLVIIGLMF